MLILKLCIIWRPHSMMCLITATTLDAIDEVTESVVIRVLIPEFQDYTCGKKRSVILMSWLKTHSTNTEQRFRITVTSQLTQWFTTSEWNDFLWLNLQRKLRNDVRRWELSRDDREKGRAVFDGGSGVWPLQEVADPLPPESSAEPLWRSTLTPLRTPSPDSIFLLNQ